MFATIERLVTEANSYQDLGQTVNQLNQDNNLNVISQGIIQMLLSQHEIMMRQGVENEMEINQRLYKYKNHIKLLLSILIEDIYQNLSTFIITSKQSQRTIEDQQVYTDYLIHTSDSQSIVNSPSFSQNTQSQKITSIKQSNTPTSHAHILNENLPGHSSLVDRRKTIDVLRSFTQQNESPLRNRENMTTQQNIMANYKLQQELIRRKAAVNSQQSNHLLTNELIPQSTPKNRVFGNRTNTIEYPAQSNLDMNQIQGIQFSQESSQDRFKRSFINPTNSTQNQKNQQISNSNAHTRSTSSHEYQQFASNSFIAKHQKKQNNISTNSNTRNNQPPLAQHKIINNQVSKQVSNKSQIINNYDTSSQSDMSKASLLKQDLERLKGSQKTEYLNNLVYSSFQNPKGPGSFKKESRFINPQGRIPTIVNDQENSPGPGFYEDQILNTKRTSVGPATFYRAKKEIFDEKSHSPGVGSYSPNYFSVK